MINMAFINYYNGKNASGTTLTDMAGSSDGTLLGASKPTIKSNGYINFIGGNGTTQGNWSRIQLVKTDFDYAWNATFSFFAIVRSTATTVGTIYSTVYDGTDERQWMTQNATTGTAQMTLRTAASGSPIKQSNTVTAINDGLWHTLAMAYSSNSLNAYKDGMISALTTNDTFSSGNFYGSTYDTLLGARANVTYSYVDYTGDIQVFIHFNHKLGNAEVKNYDAYFKGFI